MIRRVRVVHLSNGTTRTVIHEAPEISVQVGDPLGPELCHLVLRDERGRQIGAAWYTRTSYVLADSAIPQVEGNRS